MAHPENPVGATLSGKAVALATDLTERYKDMALGRARMLLYEALNNREVLQVDLLAQTCFVIMRHDRFVERIKVGTGMQDMDRKTRLQTLAGSLDALVMFAEQEDDFLLAAKLDEVRVRFTDQYTPDAK